MSSVGSCVSAPTIAADTPLRRPEQIFQIAVAAFDRAVGGRLEAPARFRDEGLDRLERRSPREGIPDQPALADVLRTDLELRLHQRDQVRTRFRQVQGCGKGLGQAYETHIADDHARRLRNLREGDRA